ncbi:MAG: hypothetical protein KAG53_04740 [Endozoicomonadaceae bacterium]|nr:hypothetical protein [Endozoicomonadaceae bacterium]
MDKDSILNFYLMPESSSRIMNDYDNYKNKQSADSESTRILTKSLRRLGAYLPQRKLILTGMP